MLDSLDDITKAGDGRFSKICKHDGLDIGCLCLLSGYAMLVYANWISLRLATVTIKSTFSNFANLGIISKLTLFE